MKACSPFSFKATILVIACLAASLHAQAPAAHRVSGVIECPGGSYTGHAKGWTHPDEVLDGEEDVYLFEVATPQRVEFSPGDPENTLSFQVYSVASDAAADDTYYVELGSRVEGDFDVDADSWSTFSQALSVGRYALVVQAVHSNEYDGRYKLDAKFLGGCSPQLVEPSAIEQAQASRRLQTAGVFDPAVDNIYTA
eukprot:scaffold697_cov235-Pinguiococcus_pyrenoidosus.AAC.13